MAEEWRDIEGYEGLYQVSNLGRVRSLDRIVVNSSGHKRTVQGVVLRATFNTNYYNVSLCKDGKVRKKNVHRLVAEAFLEKIDGKNVVDHINADVSDNRAENLQWVTTAENNRRIHELGHFDKEAASRRMRERNAKYGPPTPRKPVIMDGEIWFESATAAAKAIGAYQGNVSAVARGIRPSINGHSFIYVEKVS